MYDWSKGCEAGIGYLFECIWFDCALSGVLFFIIIAVTDLLSRQQKSYRRLLRREQLDWILSAANFLLAIVSTSGGLYILFDNEWFFHSPLSDITMAYPQSLNFFIPWMIGYELARTAHVFITVFANPNDEYLSMPDTLPHICRITLYVLIISDQMFGMLAVFQMLLESRYLFQSPMNIMQYMGKSKNNTLYNIFSVFATLIQPLFMFMAGPYCAFMLYYHWSLLDKYGFFTKFIFVFFIGVNTLFSIGDLLTLLHFIMKYVFNFDITKFDHPWVEWIKKQQDTMNKEENQERNRIARAQGYSRANTNDIDDNDNDIENDTNSMDDNSSLDDDSPNLGDNIQMTRFDVSG